MKKYFTVPMGSRGEIEIPYITETNDIKELVSEKKDELIMNLKDADYDESGIEDFLDEWFMCEEYKYGIDLGLGEEDSTIYIDIESDLFKNWGGDVDSDDEKVWDLLNSFWEGDK